MQYLTLSSASMPSLLAFLLSLTGSPFTFIRLIGRIVSIAFASGRVSMRCPRIVVKSSLSVLCLAQIRPKLGVAERVRVGHERLVSWYVRDVRYSLLTTRTYCILFQNNKGNSNRKCQLPNIRAIIAYNRSFSYDLSCTVKHCKFSDQ